MRSELEMSRTLRNLICGGEEQWSSLTLDCQGAGKGGESHWPFGPPFIYFLHISLRRAQSSSPVPVPLVPYVLPRLRGWVVVEQWSTRTQATPNHGCRVECCIRVSVESISFSEGQSGRLLANTEGNNSDGNYGGRMWSGGLLANSKAKADRICPLMGQSHNENLSQGVYCVLMMRTTKNCLVSISWTEDHEFAMVLAMVSVPISTLCDGGLRWSLGLDMAVLEQFCFALVDSTSSFKRYHDIRFSRVCSHKAQRDSTTPGLQGHLYCSVHLHRAHGRGVLGYSEKKRHRFSSQQLI